MSVRIIAEAGVNHNGDPDMALRYSPTSPYVRKVSVTLIETGLEDRVERIPTKLI